MAKPLIAGNWKMNGTKASLETAREIVSGLKDMGNHADCLLCPPATLVMTMANETSDPRLKIGGQDCHAKESGAHTGDVSAEMLADAGATYVILGHSERRSDHGETDETVAEKVGAVLRAGLTPIICIGETLEERDDGREETVIDSQLAGSLPQSLDGRDFVIAYEPVWAIGTGRVPTLEQIGAMHGLIRQRISTRFGAAGERAPILYGGSMKPDNAEAILAVENVNGGLIGGASLKAKDFLSIYAVSAAAG